MLSPKFGVLLNFDLGSKGQTLCNSVKMSTAEVL